MDCGKLADFSGATTTLLFWLTVTLEREGAGVVVTRLCDRTSPQVRSYEHGKLYFKNVSTENCRLYGCFVDSVINSGFFAD